MIGQQKFKCSALIGGFSMSYIPGVQVGVGYVLLGLAGDVGDCVHLLLGVANNKIVITSVIRESERDWIKSLVVLYGSN